jgi:hypothetical protein
MDIDPPTPSQANKSNQQQNPRATTRRDLSSRGWKKRGFQVLHYPHVRPSEQLEVFHAISQGAVTDWDLWEAVMDEVFECDYLLCFAFPPVSRSRIGSAAQCCSICER